MHYTPIPRMTIRKNNEVIEKNGIIKMMRAFDFTELLRWEMLRSVDMRKWGKYTSGRIEHLYLKLIIKDS